MSQTLTMRGRWPASSNLFCRYARQSSVLPPARGLPERPARTPHVPVGRHDRGLRAVPRRAADVGLARARRAGRRPATPVIAIPDRGAFLSAFISGQVDQIYGVQPQEEPQIRSSMKSALWTLSPGPTWDHFAVNLKLPQFQDDRVRQAYLGL